MKQKRLIRFVFLVLLAVTAFHLSGIEAAFCEDGIDTSQSASHGCAQCHAGQHAASVVTSSVVPHIPSLSFLQFSHVFLKHESPSLGFFRPPIFA